MEEINQDEIIDLCFKEMDKNHATPNPFSLAGFTYCGIPNREFDWSRKRDVVKDDIQTMCPACADAIRPYFQ